MNHKPGPGPAPSERTLFALWDHIDRTRQQHGERAAEQLATKALRAIAPPEPPVEQKEQDQ